MSTDNSKEISNNPPRFETGGCNTDPYSQEHIIYLALKTAGFPIVFEPDEKLTHGQERGGTGRTEDWLKVLTNSEQNAESIKRLRFWILGHGIGTLLSNIDYARPHTLSTLLKGNEEEYYFLTPQKDLPSLRYRINLETLSRSFMAAYERHQERSRDGTAYYPSSAPDDKDRDIYKNFQQAGLLPIDPEALGLMTKQVITDYIHQTPWLRPQV